MCVDEATNSTVLLSFLPWEYYVGGGPWCTVSDTGACTARDWRISRGFNAKLIIIIMLEYIHIYIYLSLSLSCSNSYVATPPTHNNNIHGPSPISSNNIHQQQHQHTIEYQKTITTTTHNREYQKTISTTNPHTNLQLLWRLTKN